VLFFERIWGSLSSAVQIGVVWAAPLVLLAAAAQTARVERTLYFTALLSTVAFGCFVLDVWTLGSVLNASPSPMPFLAWSLFALALAYAWDLRLMLAVGATCLIAFVGTAICRLVNLPVEEVFSRPESLLPPAAAVAAWSLSPTNQVRHGFPGTLRLVGLLV